MWTTLGQACFTSSFVMVRKLPVRYDAGPHKHFGRNALASGSRTFSRGQDALIQSGLMSFTIDGKLGAILLGQSAAYFRAPFFWSWSHERGIGRVGRKDLKKLREESPCHRDRNSQANPSSSSGSRRHFRRACNKGPTLSFLARTLGRISLHC